MKKITGQEVLPSYNYPPQFIYLSLPWAVELYTSFYKKCFQPPLFCSFLLLPYSKCSFVLTLPVSSSMTCQMESTTNQKLGHCEASTFPSFAYSLSTAGSQNKCIQVRLLLPILSMLGLYQSS